MGILKCRHAGHCLTGGCGNNLYNCRVHGAPVRS